MTLLSEIDFFNKNDLSKKFVKASDFEEGSIYEFQLIQDNLVIGYNAFIAGEMINIPYNCPDVEGYYYEQFKERMDKLLLAQEKKAAKEGDKSASFSKEAKRYCALYCREIKEKSSKDVILFVENNTNVLSLVTQINKVISAGVDINCVRFQFEKDSKTKWKLIIKVAYSGRFLTFDPIIDAEPCNINALFYPKANPFSEGSSSYRKDKKLLEIIQNKLLLAEMTLKEFM